MSCETDHRPNIWALRLIETIADNLSISNPELNAAYKDCLRALHKITKSQKPKLTLVDSENTQLTVKADALGHYLGNHF